METNPTTVLRHTRFSSIGLLIAACLGGPVAFGQEAAPRATFVGLSAGIGTTLPGSQTRLELPPGSYLDPTGEPGVALALAALVRLQRGHWFGQPELRYQNLYSAPVQYPGGGGGYGSLFSGGAQRSFHAQQLGVNVLGGYSFGAQQRFYALLGPGIAKRLGNDGVPTPDLSPNAGVNDSVPYVIDQAPEGTQFQLHSGLGWWGKHLDVELRYTYGLTPLVRRVEFNGQAYDFKVRASTLALTLGYHLPL